MYWWNWISVYMIIIASALLFIIPEKPWWLWISLLVTGGVGVLFVAILPHKKDKYLEGDS